MAEAKYIWSGAECNCLWGTPTSDPVTGECRCINETGGIKTPQPASPPLVKPLVRHGPDGGVWAYMPYSNTSIVDTTKPKTAPASADDGKILGMRPLVFFAVLAGGFWLLSQSDKQQKVA